MNLAEINIQPDRTANDYFNLANEFRLSAQLTEAVSAYQRAIALNSNFSWYHFNLGEVLSQLERWEEAVISYQTACQLDPHSAWSFGALGKALVHQQKLEQAIPAFQQAIELNPEISEFHALLGQTLFQADQLDQGIEILQQAVQLDPESPLANEYLWEALARQGRGEQGLHYLQRAAELHGGKWELYQKLGEVSQGRGDLVTAIQCYHQVLRLNPNSAWIFFKLGVAVRDQGQQEAAIAHFRQAVNLQPDLDIAHHYLGHTLSLAEQWEEAITCYQTAIELAPKSAIIHRHLGEAFVALQNWEAAAQQYLQGIELEPDSVEMHSSLGFVLAQLERWDEVVKYYWRAIELDPYSDDLKEQLAEALLSKHLKAIAAQMQQVESYSDYSGQDPYDLWREANEPRLADLHQMKQTLKILSYKPLISVILPVYNTPQTFLQEAIESVLSQIYPDWELCIADDASTESDIRQVIEAYRVKDSRIKAIFRSENGHISACSNSALALATGDFVALLDHDDLLAPHALYEIALLLNQHPQADMIYSDEDKVDEKGYFKHPFFKPDWCPDSFLSRMYTCHLGVYRRELVNKIGGFRVGFEGSQDYDLVLRLTEKTDNIFHIPKILYHWRIHSGSVTGGTEAKPYAYDAAKKALMQALSRRSEAGTVTDVPELMGAYTIHYEIKEHRLVSIIIPTRDLGKMLDRCLESIFSKTMYPKYEVIVVDNGSRETETKAVLKKWQQRQPQKFRSYLLDTPFDFSKINNDAAEKSYGEYLLFLNNDTEVITSNWITFMVEQAQRSSIGAVGSLLLYPDDTIQHAGIVMGLGGLAAHGHSGFPSTILGYAGQVKSISNVSAVTGACLMCRRAVFEQVSGFDEKLAIAYNDVDLCLKMLAQGYHNIYLPHVVLYHHESKSRGYDNTLEKQQRLNREADIIRSRWQNFIDHDPSYNPNLTKKFTNYSLNISLPRIRIEAVLKSELDSELLRDFNIDQPVSQQDITAISLPIKGWVLGKNSPIIAVEVIYNNRVFTRILANQIRQDVANVYPGVVGAEKSGFDSVIRVRGIPAGTKIGLQAILRDGSSVSLGTIELGTQTFL
ncbi:MAG: tetratricopeptide repeat protein [Oscillatoriales cyanobacterium RM2_1_1]|nr:tetratricopeptide repeat protein [Oscillatoriales cyanobacterium SM2_3_0]NJO47134.1 tetratricopeptide repeat protein [Oscillatoriales cyanobacterium RM2_1_1]